jgi:hypothetical protein
MNETAAGVVGVELEDRERDLEAHHDDATVSRDETERGPVASVLEHADTLERKPRRVRDQQRRLRTDLLGMILDRLRRREVGRRA